MIKTMFVQTPGLMLVSNYFIVQQLIIERVKSVITGIRFSDNIAGLVSASLDYPPYCRSPSQIEDWLNTTCGEIISSFEHYEQSPAYNESIQTLKQYQGWKITLLSSNVNGVLIGITKP